MILVSCKFVVSSRIPIKKLPVDNKYLLNTEKSINNKPRNQWKRLVIQGMCKEKLKRRSKESKE